MKDLRHSSRNEPGRHSTAIAAESGTWKSDPQQKLRGGRARPVRKSSPALRRRDRPSRRRAGPPDRGGLRRRAARGLFRPAALVRLRRRFWRDARESESPAYTKTFWWRSTADGGSTTANRRCTRSQSTRSRRKRARRSSRSAPERATTPPSSPVWSGPQAG